MERKVESDFIRQCRETTEAIGKDKNDFIPVYGFINYSRRAWSILKDQEDVENTNMELYIGYGDKVTAFQFATSFTLFAMASYTFWNSIS